MKRPSMQFYPRDWLRDLDLRQCSLAARGFWADLLCLMHDGEPYGHLETKSGPMTDLFLATQIGIPTSKVKQFMNELEGHKVFSRTTEGVIYSRRMVRDEKLRLVRANGGVKSIEHPNTPKPKKGTHQGYPSRVPSRENPTPTLPAGGEDEEEENPIRDAIFEPGQTEPPAFDPTPGWVWFSSVYPRHKINRILDAEPYMEVVRTGDIELKIREHLPRAMRTQQWTKAHGQYVPRARNYLMELQFEVGLPPEESGGSGPDPRLVL